MSSRVWMLAALGVGVIAAAIFWLWPAEPTSQRSILSAGNPTSGDTGVLKEISALRRDNERLRADVDEMRKHTPSGSSVGRAAQSSAAAGEAAAQFDEEESEDDGAARDTEQLASQFAAIESGFRSQKRDPAWSDNANRTIASALERNRTDGASANPMESLAGSTIRESDCRATLCRVVVTYTDAQAVAAFMHTFPSRVSAELPQIVYEPTQASNGALTSVIYLARTGSSFPQVGEQ